MSQWVLRGLRTGIKTTPYPQAPDVTAGVTPGRPLSGEYRGEQARLLVNRCPTGALRETEDRVVVDYRRCVHSFRCLHGTPTPLPWASDYEWARLRTHNGPRFGKAFERSLHILVVDAGDCGACLNEVKQLSNPYYNLHRVGLFITPTPRQADVLLVVGPVTDHMRLPLQKAFDAMPPPKAVVAVGACALSGSVFGPSFVCGAGVAELLPVDVEVPGHPPPPLAILHGLLLATGRTRSAPQTPTGEAGDG